MNSIYGFIPRIEVLKSYAKSLGLAFTEYWDIEKVIHHYNTVGCHFN